MRIIIMGKEAALRVRHRREIILDIFLEVILGGLDLVVGPLATVRDAIWRRCGGCARVAEGAVVGSGGAGGAVVGALLAGGDVGGLLQVFGGVGL